VNFWSHFPSNCLLAEASLWSADLTRLRTEIERVDSLVDLYHIDVADAHFVPGLLLFPDLVAAVRPLTRRPFHVHLMVDNPLSLIDDFADAGADMITIHAENGSRVTASLDRIKHRGLAAGLALGLDVPLASLTPNIESISVVVLMGTPMGVKGMDLSPLAVERVARVRALVADKGAEETVRVECDGGIRPNTVPALRKAGAQLVVMGSLVFKSRDIASTFAWVRSLEESPTSLEGWSPPY
jgi:ribulose-phosphate 3-epimerase